MGLLPSTEYRSSEEVSVPCHGIPIHSIKGLVRRGRYALSWSFNYSVADHTVASGATLLGESGLRIDLRSPGSSVLVEYSPVQ